jgi:hypothetical protein
MADAKAILLRNARLAQSICAFKEEMTSNSLCAKADQDRRRPSKKLHLPLMSKAFVQAFGP